MSRIASIAEPALVPAGATCGIALASARLRALVRLDPWSRNS
jgi:hypothetical protein